MCFQAKQVENRTSNERFGFLNYSEIFVVFLCKNAHMQNLLRLCVLNSAKQK